MKKREFVISLICGGILAVTAPAFAQEGGWSKAEVDDPDVVAAAKFALQEAQKKTDKKLKLEKIVDAKQQLVAGMNYSVALQLTEGGDKREAEAVVYQNLDDEYSLTSWKWKKTE